jgi:hypothetical protein
METPKEYYYTYYSYEEWGRGYFGSRGCKCLPEEDVKYFGSSKDKTFRPIQKIILKDDYTTREEAYTDEIILQRYYKVVENPHFANKAYQTSTKFSYIPSKEESIKNGKKGGSKGGIKAAQTNKKNGTSIFALTPEQLVENGKKSSKLAKQNGTGFYSLTKEQLKEIGRRSGLKTKENKTGIFALTKEQRSINGKKSGAISYEKAKELGIGICGLTEEQRKKRSRKASQKSKECGIGIYGIAPEKRLEYNKKGAKISNTQKWKCLETEYITTAGALSNYQKSRGIDTSKRVRVE